MTGRLAASSSPLPGRPGWSIWLFCDTAVMSAHAGRTERLILGSGTAAAGPYQLRAWGIPSGQLIAYRSS